MHAALYELYWASWSEVSATATGNILETSSTLSDLCLSRSGKLRYAPRRRLVDLVDLWSNGSA